MGKRFEFLIYVLLHISSNGLIHDKVNAIAAQFKAKQKERHSIPREIFQMIHGIPSAFSPQYIMRSRVEDDRLRESGRGSPPETYRAQVGRCIPHSVPGLLPYTGWREKPVGRPDISHNG